MHLEHSTLVLLFILVFTMPFYCQRCSGKVWNNELKFIHVSDIHLNPFYDKNIDANAKCRLSVGSNYSAAYEAPYGRMGCDSPEELLTITLAGMKEKGRDAKFIIMSGDSASHHLEDDHGSLKVLKVISLVSRKLHEAFPEIPVFPAFGNHDLPGPYILPNNSDWYKTVLSYWAPLILCSKCPDDVNKPTTMEALNETFMDGGYYRVNILDGKMILLVLNTMYWHIKRTTNPVVDEIAEHQMQWLKKQLQMAKDQWKKVLLMSHMPAGGDPYGFKFLWRQEYLKQYVRLTAGKYHDVVTGQLFGHTHRDDFQLQILDVRSREAERASTKSFVLMAPSISPVTRSNPAFRVMSLNTDKQALVDYDQYFLDLVIATESSKPVWQFHYTFSKQYPSKNIFINADRIDELNQQLISQTDGTYWHAYMASTTVNYQPGPYDRRAMYCIMRYVFEEDFKKCHGNFTVPVGSLHDLNENQV